MQTINQLVREFEKVCEPAPARQITVSNLLNQETGKLNRDVYEALVRREAMRTFGSTAPRYLRQAGKFYRCHVSDQVTAWRIARGLPVAMTMVAPFPQARFRGSTF